MRHRFVDMSSVMRAWPFQRKIFFALALFLAIHTIIGIVCYLKSLGAGDRFGGDFICFWQAAQRARHGDFGTIYDADLWRRVLSARTPPKITWFVYPPFSLFGLQLLGRMTYTQAVAWWSLAPIAFYFALLSGLARKSEVILGRAQSSQGDGLGWPGKLMMAAMPLAFLTANLFCGQTGAIVAVLFLAAAYFWRDRPLVAGLFIGLIAIKPQLGLLFPVALAAAGQWRTFIAAAVTVAVMVTASVAWAGTGLWADYLHLTQVFGHFIGLGHGRIGQLAVGPYVSLLGAGLPITVAAVAQAIISLAVLAAVFAVFRRKGVKSDPSGCPDARLDLRLAILATGSLLMTPYALSYDTPLLAVAVVPLFVRAWRRDWDGWELAAMMALVVVPYAQQFGGRVPLGLGALLLTFVVLGRRYLLEAPACVCPARGPRTQMPGGSPQSAVRPPSAESTAPWSEGVASDST